MDWLDIKEFIKDTLKYILFIIVVLVIAIYVIGLQQIIGNSMNPTLNNNDVVIIDKLTPKFINLKRGDIISFYHDETKYLVKRIIGLPGEHVKIKDNNIYINGKIIEDYVQNIKMEDFDIEELGYSIIPEDMYFVMGDNREDSLDSRNSKVSLVKKEDIVGKKLIILWPIFK